jgi:pimeloyl-ACP methyl ester carboxylesterase
VNNGETMRLRHGPGTLGVPLLVVPDLAHTGDEWQDVLDVWSGPSVAPDFPGHGQSPPPVGGKYVPGDATLAALRVLHAVGWDEPPVVLGHGWGAYAAEYLAAAGRVRALVMVDGLGGPWRTPVEITDSQTAWLHRALEHHGAPAVSPDPLLRLGFPDVWEAEFTRARRAAITVAVLALETPMSPTPADEREARTRDFGGEAVWRTCTRADVAGHLMTVAKENKGR